MLRLLQEALQKIGSDVLAGMTGSPVQVLVRLDSSTVPPDMLWLRYGLPESNATMWAGAGATDWRAIANTVLGDPDSVEETPDTKPTFLEVVNQIASASYRVLSAKAGRELLPGPGAECSGPGEGQPLWMELELSPSRRVRVYMILGNDLLESGGPAQPEPEPLPKRSNEPPQTMDLLLDVELPVAVSFGRAQLPLKDVIKLTSGSIVELNRAVTEPVEVIVNNCVIARGEVVVVEGNYGIRIQEIVSRSERLRTLH